jgi:hypothetical protein
MFNDEIVPVGALTVHGAEVRVMGRIVFEPTSVGLPLAGGVTADRLLAHGDEIRAMHGESST